MNKGFGTAFGFLLVLLVLGLGFYVAFTGFRSTRAALLAQPTATARPPTATSKPTNPPTATYTPIPTPIPGISLTQTATARPSATPKGFKPTKTPKPKKTATPLPPTATVPEVGNYQFRPAGPAQLETNVGCCYLLGTVRDAAGLGQEGVRIRAKNAWNAPVIAVTKGGNELGQYNVPIGPDKVSWSLIIVDESGQQISTEVIVPFDGTVAPGMRVDWKKMK